MPAPIPRNCMIIARRVSGCVEPGAGSALLKLGLRSTFLPRIGFTPSSSTAWRTPSARLAVFTRATVPCQSSGVGWGVGVQKGVAVGSAIVLVGALVGSGPR